MASDAHDGLTFYPAYCFKASPTYFTWVKLSCASVHSLQTRKGFEGQHIYFHLNHPVQFVCLVGVIVAFDDTNPKRWIMTLDDSSGATIEIVYPKPEVTAAGNETTTLEPHVDPEKDKEQEDDVLDLAVVDIGTVIKAKGTIDTWWDMRQLKLERMVVIADTASEVKCWDQQTKFFVDILSKPWVVSSEEQKRLLREVEGVKDKDRGRIKRRQERQRRLQERERRDAAKILKAWEKEEREREKEAQACRDENAKSLRRQCKETSPA